MTINNRLPADAEKQMHVHKPMIQAVLTYEHERNRIAKVIKPGNPESERELIGLLRWATQAGVTLTIRPA